ncbi:hypothetical protein IFM89_012554 [Coptis chinensis]|uniref:Fatty acyl-CoA reductase n=1 Tax=Coptis chinensis TaxID=261450 RepID=A0A835H4M8_9MAGN|nr:hypothetical protein IFM89_012554 [Coptis chinensis]
MSSLFLHRVSFASKEKTIDDLLENKKSNMVKLCCRKYSSNATISNELSSHLSELTVLPTMSKRIPLPALTSVGIKEVALNGKVKEEMKPKEMVFSDGIGIVRFLRGKVFLITGATGFLAKVLIEKILRTVPDVGKIYVLMKAKDKEVAMERLKKEIINTELFKRVHQSHGKSHQAFMLNKLVAVVGNVCESNLGMEVDLADSLVNEVDIVVNSAGNTTFDERFDVSLSTNTLGPCRVLSFAKKCKKLLVFVHVSTAYANGERQGVILEKPFSIGDSIAREKASLECPVRFIPPLDVDAELKRALDTMDDSQADIVSHKMKELGLERARNYGWQDTYVFSKAMAEMMIDSQREDIPVVIIRPSVIVGTYKEPIPGWIEGIRMMDPVILSYGKGELTGFPSDPKGVLDTVPADMVVNAILAATVKHASMRKPGLSIYQIASSVANPLVFEDLFSYLFQYFCSSPYMDLNRRPINVQRMKVFNSIDDFNTHIQTEAVQKSEDSKGRMSRRRIKDH